MRLISQTPPLSFIDVYGIERTVVPCSVTKREELRLCLDQIYAYTELIANEVEAAMTFENLYDEHQSFKRLIARALNICRIDPSWLSLDMVYAFVLPHKDGEDNMHANGILVELNFASLPSRQKNSKGSDATYIDTLAALWSSLGDLQQALTLADTDDIPADELLRLVAHKNRMEYEQTEAGQKAKKRREAMELANTLNNQQ